MDEKNRSLRLNGHAWNWGDGPLPCTVRGRDFGLEEAKRAMMKGMESQDTREALRPKSSALAKVVKVVAKQETIPMRKKESSLNKRLKT